MLSLKLAAQNQTPKPIETTNPFSGTSKIIILDIREDRMCGLPEAFYIKLAQRSSALVLSSNGM